MGRQGGVLVTAARKKKEDPEVATDVPEIPWPIRWLKVSGQDPVLQQRVGGEWVDVPTEREP